MKKTTFIVLVLLLKPFLAYANQIPYQTYLNQAATIYQQMTLDEKIGQLLLPTYRLLATGVTQPSGQEPGYLCQQAVQQHANTEKLMQDCGLDQITKYHIGAVEEDGGRYFNYPSLENWQRLNSLAIKAHQKNNKHDPLLLIGEDAIHGNGHVAGAVIFPHNINLGVTHNPKLIQQIGALTANDSLASGFNWVFMPTVAVAQDLRWGRTYESFGQDPALVKQAAKAYITGFQQINHNKVTGVLATAKHFIGDGATQYGMDEGDAIFAGDQKQFWLENGLGYEGALQANVLSVMISFSAINGNPMHFGGAWNIVNEFKTSGITGSDKNLYQFKGFAVSDYNGPTRAAYIYNQNHPDHPLVKLAEIYAKAMNAGVDMIMVGNGDTHNPLDPQSPYYYTNVGQAAAALREAYEEKLIPEARLKDAVTRILAVKLAMSPQMKIKQYNELQQVQRKLALQAAEQSLVLLKNAHDTLPLKIANIKNVVFLGASNDLGVQNGGWTINWQGLKGNDYFKDKEQYSSGAATVEQAITQRVKEHAQFFHAANIAANIARWSSHDTIAIAVLAEPPYAEYMGDIANSHKVDRLYAMGIKEKQNIYMPSAQSHQLSLHWSNEEAQAIHKLRSKHIPVIVVVFSGRPVILTAGGEAAPLPHSDALIAAFLPGTLGGEALANAIFGDYHFRQNGFSNTLTFPWPRNMNDVINHFSDGALYPIGYGLSYSQRKN